METWGTFSSYDRDGHSKLVFVQRRQDSCVVMRENSEISTRLDRATGMLLELRQKTEGPLLVSTVILGFLSIFKKSQASSAFEAFNSMCLSRGQRDLNPLRIPQRKPQVSASSGQGASDPFDPSRGTRNLMIHKETMPDTS